MVDIRAVGDDRHRLSHDQFISLWYEASPLAQSAVEKGERKAERLVPVWAGHQLEVKVWLAAIAGVAARSENVSLPDAVAAVDFHRIALDVRIERECSDVERHDDVVAEQGVRTTDDISHRPLDKQV